MSTHSAGPHYVSCDECGRNTPKFKDMARLMASIRGWDFDRPSASHRCPDCGGTGVITRDSGDRCAPVEDICAERDALRAQVQAVRDVCEQQVKDRSLYSADRQLHTLDHIDGWNDALDIVEQALDGAK